MARKAFSCSVHTCYVMQQLMWISLRPCATLLNPLPLVFVRQCPRAVSLIGSFCDRVPPLERARLGDCTVTDCIDWWHKRLSIDCPQRFHNQGVQANPPFVTMSCRKSLCISSLRNLYGNLYENEPFIRKAHIKWLAR